VTLPKPKLNKSPAGSWMAKESIMARIMVVFLTNRLPLIALKMSTAPFFQNGAAPDENKLF
jgi:hypothetical protein